MTDELKEQAALFALGLLEPEERETFLTALSRDSALVALLDEYHATMAIVALAPELREPPADLRETILFQAADFAGRPPVGAVVPTELPALYEGRDPAISVAEDVPADPVAPPVVSFFPRHRSPLMTLPWLVAASLALACGVLFFRVIALQKENTRIVAEKGVEYLRIAVLEPQAASLPGISARVAWNPESGSGLIETAALPAPGAEKTYQLWVFEKDNPVPVSAGVFDPIANPRIIFRPEREVENAVTFAVSIEVAGGRPQPEGEVVLAGTIVSG